MYTHLVRILYAITHQINILKLTDTLREKREPIKKSASIFSLKLSLSSTFSRSVLLCQSQQSTKKQSKHFNVEKESQRNFDCLSFAIMKGNDIGTQIYLTFFSKPLSISTFCFPIIIKRQRKKVIMTISSSQT